MFAAYLTRGVTAGLVAGLVLGLFVAVVANPLVVYTDETNHAAGEGHDHGHGGEGDGHGHEGADGHAGEGSHEESAVSMAVTTSVSVLASVLWAVLLGGVVFGAAFYVLEPAIPGTGATKSLLLGAAGFVTVSGAPWLVVPPAPPGAEQSLAVGTRILLYGGMMVAGALACLSAGYVYNRVCASSGRLVAAVAALLPFALLATSPLIAPTNTVEGALDPTLEAGLFGLIVFGQVLVWLVLATTHALLRTEEGTGARPASTGADTAVSAD